MNEENKQNDLQNPLSNPQIDQPERSGQQNQDSANNNFLNNAQNRQGTKRTHPIDIKNPNSKKVKVEYNEDLETRLKIDSE